MLERVLVTLDGSSASEAALPAAVHLLSGTSAEVHLLMVADVPTATREHPEQERLTVGVPAPGGVVRLKPAATVETRDQAMARIADELRDYLSAEATPLEKAGIPVHAAVRFGQPADEIVRYANEQKMDLIVMATHGHTGLARLVFGGVASQVVANGGYPVLLVRPQSLNDG